MTKEEEVITKALYENSSKEYKDAIPWDELSKETKELWYNEVKKYKII